MIRRPPRSTRTDTLFPYTTLFRSLVGTRAGNTGGSLGRLAVLPARLEIGRNLEPQYVHADRNRRRRRSEEHTSELQSLMRISYAVFCLKKKKKTQPHYKLQISIEQPTVVHLKHMKT